MGFEPDEALLRSLIAITIMLDTAAIAIFVPIIGTDLPFLLP